MALLRNLFIAGLLFASIIGASLLELVVGPIAGLALITSWVIFFGLETFGESERRPPKES